MNPLNTFFIHSGFNPDEAQEIAASFAPKYFKKGDHFVSEGVISSQLAFVASGMFQYYTNTEAGEERTTYVSLENSFVASLLSYLMETPARENIRAMTEAMLFIIEKQKVLQLQERIPAFKDFYIRLLEWQICCIDKSKFDLIALSAEQRYDKLLREEPHLLQQVPLQYIASMLGITPRHLSRLRGKE